MRTATITTPSVIDMELALETLLLDAEHPDDSDIYLVQEDGLWSAMLGQTTTACAQGKLVRHFSHATGEDRYPVMTATLHSDGASARVVLLEDTGEVIPIPTEA